MLDSAYLLRWIPHPPVTLLADPDDASRHSVASFLSHSGCAIDEVSDGRVALARALSAKVDIVVAAEELPGLNAAQLVQVLRGDTVTSATPIVVINAKEDHVGALKSAGADAVLARGTIPAALAIEMQQLLTASGELRKRSARASAAAKEQVTRSSQLLQTSLQHHRAAMSRAHARTRTQSPSIEPPAVVCPQCDRPLRYEYSHTGGVNEKQAEQWDYFVCSSGCGTFQFRHRTNKLRKV